MTNFQTQLEKYAELAVKIGVNIQKGQTLVVNAPIQSAEFVRFIAKKAYEAGAKNVHVEWNDEQLSLIKFQQAPDEAFHEFPQWRAKGFEEMAEAGAAFMSITANNPDLFQHVDPKRIANANIAQGKAMATYRRYIQSDKVAWTVIAAASPGWAKKVFPTLPEEEAVAKLWEAIFAATRVNIADPVQAWKDHHQALDDKVKFLNNKKYKALHFTAEGTDLTVGLDEKHIWAGGGSINEANTFFMANMPTEEVFTTPDKNNINGTVTSTKPLNYGGSLINNFSLTFEAGKVVHFTSEEGYDTLERLLATDDGAKSLGEVALVPHNSPISLSNIIFYNTLFDENASNHVALGSAYAFCIEGGKTMTVEELEQAGANQSIIHVDFMIGSADMNIDGVTKDGKREPLFRNGNWAF